MLAPIVLFCYNRPRHTEKTLIALSNNFLADQSQLIVFCDGPKQDATEEQRSKILQVREVVKGRKWCKDVIVCESIENKGLANSVIEGVTQTINKYGKVIVLEDDLLTAKGFLKYMNEALDKYADYDNVMQISGHQFPLWNWKRKKESFFLPVTTSWGWGTWKRAWDKFDHEAIGFNELESNSELKYKFNLNGSYPYSDILKMQMNNSMKESKIDSWAIKWWWSVFRSNGIILFPDKTLINNVGYGIDATHTTIGTNEQNEFKGDYSIKIFPEIASSDLKFFENYLFQKKQKHEKRGLLSYFFKSSNKH